MTQFLFNAMRGFIVVILFFISLFSVAQVAERPNPERLYNNLSKEFPNFLSVTESDMLEQKLVGFSRETSNQICVVVVDDLNGMDASSYAIELGTSWGVGKKEFDNGLVILIKPTGGSGGRDLFIAVGYGLEGAIPDLATKRIREDEMYPYLKNGENFKALDKATDKLMALAKGEINAKDYSSSSEGKNDILQSILIIALIFFFVWIFSKGGGLGGGGYTYSSGRSSGGFGGGSSSGGGFGGFGGGSFGGGGSGGKW